MIFKEQLIQVGWSYGRKTPLKSQIWGPWILLCLLDFTQRTSHRVDKIKGNNAYINM